MNDVASLEQVGPSELQSRKDLVLEAMARDAIDLAIFTSPASILYLAGIQLGGYWGQQALILNKAGESAFVLRNIETGWYDSHQASTWCHDWRPYSDEDDPVAVVIAAAKSCRRDRTNRIALENDRRTITSRAVNEIVAKLQADTVASAARLVESLRAQKSDGELALIRQAGRITVLGVDAAAQAIRNGASDSAAAAAAFSALCMAGSEFLCTGPGIAVGSSTAGAHARWTGSTPAEGEVVAMTVGASVGRYQCPLERTFVLGRADNRLTHMFDTIVESVEAVLEVARPGMTSHDVDRIAREIIDEAGYGKFFLNRLAYSFGIGYPPVWWENEIMQLRQNDQRTVRPGMVFHLVPALHVPGVGFLNRSLPVVVTDDRLEPLIDYPLRLDAL